jgi:dTDP-4-amino-4,6-dideoxygalactose transaminase
MSARVPFLDLRLGDDAAAVRRAIDRVIDRGWFILGPELDAFEQEFAAAMGAQHAVGVGTGTDALALLLRGLGIGAGDEVITAPVSAAYSALAIQMAGATPVFADLDPVRMTLDPHAVAAAITPRTRAIMPVHLYGQPADMPALTALAARHGLAIVEDACQAHGATCAGRPVGSFGAGAAFSFYPTKNLGALGDGGAITTNDAALAERLKRLRNGGQSNRYRHETFGVNSRLDEMQAAILRARLPHLPAWTSRRREIARQYRDALAVRARSAAEGDLIVPAECDPGHVYHLFAVRSAQRERVRATLADRGVETLIHYPIALPDQPVFDGLGGPCPEGVRLSNEVFSLPLHPGLSPDDVQAVIDDVQAVIAAVRS